VGADDAELTCVGLFRLQNFIVPENSRESTMIGYVTLGTKDIQKAAAFYDKIAAEMGINAFVMG
jgi:hypothetical protein